METVLLSDLRVTHLDDEERNSVVSELSAEAVRIAESFKSITISSLTGKQVDGASFFSIANEFENHVPNLSLEDNLERIESWVRNIDLLIAAAPDYYQLRFLKGRIWLLALFPRENYVIANREIIAYDPPLMLFKKQILDTYVVIEECHRKAMQLFVNTHAGQERSPISAYLTIMKCSLATYYRRHGYFIIRSVKAEQIRGQDMEEAYQFIMRSHQMFEPIFANDIFMDVNTAGIALSAWANAMKLVPDSKERALRYYRAARTVCGDHPYILEGIKYLEELLSDNPGAQSPA
jgi:hypothetical protein